MQFLIGCLALPRIACFALGDTPKARFWGNLLGLLGCPLWLAMEARAEQWGMMFASLGGLVLYSMGIWRLIQPRPVDPLVVDALSDDEALEQAMSQVEAQTK